MSFFEFALNIILSFVENYGLLGISILSLIEIIITPIPSEIVLPLAGYIAYSQNNFLYLILASLFSSISALIGSFVLYYIGYFGRFYFIKYILVSEKRMKKAEKWFEKYGNKTVLFCRSIPGLRSVISIPAGIAKMSLKKYAIYSFLGFLIWNSALINAGYILKENWEIIISYSKTLDFVGIVIIVIFIVYVFIKLKQKPYQP
ncbi:MAG: DedA family protein [Candidatus Aenigmatarchaeota archaeon]